MAEDNEFTVIESSAFVGSTDKDLDTNYSQGERLSDRQGILTPESGSVDTTAYMLGVRQQISVANPGGPTARFSATATGTRKPKTAVLERSYIAAETGPSTELVTFSATSDGFSAVPYDVNGTSVYQIGIRTNAIPTAARLKLNGDNTWLRWTSAIGERATINNITEPVPGNGIRIYLVPVGFHAPWTDGTKTRPCRVWHHPTGVAVDDPPYTTGSEAIYDGVLESDGVSVWVDVTHYFGQAAPGDNNVVHYHVHVHGFTISDKAIVDLTTINVHGVRRYLVLGEFDSATGTTDYSMQPTAQSLMELSSSSQIAQLLTDALRAGLNIGDLDAQAAWNDSGSVVTAIGATYVTFTFGDPFGAAVDEYICTGANEGPTSGQGPTVSNNFRTGGLVASLLVAAAAVNYTIFAYVDSANLLYLAIEATAGVTAALRRRCLEIATFDWNGAAVLNYAPFDLNSKRGIGWGNLIGGGAETDGHHHTLDDVALTRVGNDVIATFFALTNAAPPVKQQIGWLRKNDAGADFVDLTIDPHSGGVAGLTAGEYANLGLGTLGTDYRIVAWGAAAANDRYLSIIDSTGEVVFVRKLGGESVGTTQRVTVPDLHLWPTDGKIISRIAPLEGGWGDVDAYQDAAINRALPRWDVCSLEDQSGFGAGGASTVILNTVIADAYSLTTSDVFVIKCAFRIEDNSESLLLLQISLYDGADNTIWDHAAGPYTAHAESAGDLAYVEIHVSVTALGAAGALRVTYPIETWDPALAPPNSSPFGQPGSSYEGRLTPQATVANFDTTVDTRLRVISQYAVGAGTEEVVVERIDVTRSRRDLWRTNLKDGWYLETGNNRYLRIPLPVDQANAHELVDCDVYCMVGSGGAATCRLAMDLIEYDPVTGVETSVSTGIQYKQDALIANKVTVTATDPTLILADKRYFLKVASQQTTAGGQFEIHHVEYRTRIYQIQ